jgi:hypothetical protein
VFLLSVVTGCNLSVPIDLELKCAEYVRATLVHWNSFCKPLCSLVVMNTFIQYGTFVSFPLFVSLGKAQTHTDAPNVCSRVKVFHLHCYAVSLSGLHSHYLL